MKKKASAFSVLCVVFLFIFTAFMAWYLPSMSSIKANTAEARQSLDTSRGRENKQQAEYDKAVEELPQVQAQLLEAAPLAVQAGEKVDLLKARRKELRAEKKELEQKISGSDTVQKEDDSNE